MKAIDVSLHQGKIDWAKVKASGIEAVIIRCLKRSGVDDYWLTNYKGAKAVGLKVGVYVFSYAQTEQYAITEASRCLTQIKGKDLDFPVWLDLEWETQGKLGRAKVTSIAKAFMETIKAGGYECGIYSNQSWHDKLIDWVELGNPDWWAARIGKKPTGTYTIHQYDWYGKVNGISGNVDMDDIIKDYSDDYYAPVGKLGWVQDAKGDWYYRDTPTTNVHGWKKVNGHWYYFDGNGKMLTGWFEVDGKKYFAEDSNAKLLGALYRTDDSGAQSIWDV